LAEKDSTGDASQGEASYLWLEDIDGKEALRWVEAQNQRCHAAIASPELQALERRLLSIYQNDRRIPYVTARGDQYYNFWQDRDHPRGLWRRTTWEQYLGDHPAWEVVLDVDALSASEGESWVWKGAHALRPRFDRALVELSRGGSYASSS
jgi:prolyl oligopeptidase